MTTNLGLDRDNLDMNSGGPFPYRPYGSIAAGASKE